LLDQAGVLPLDAFNLLPEHREDALQFLDLFLESSDLFVLPCNFFLEMVDLAFGIAQLASQLVHQATQILDESLGDDYDTAGDGFMVMQLDNLTFGQNHTTPWVVQQC